MVSVIIPTYGRANRIVEAINSVLNQTYPASEIIVIDDNGKDSVSQVETEKKLKSFIFENKIKYLINEKNQGANKSRNIGIKIAKSDYVAFLDDDDSFYPEKLERISEVIKKNNDISLIYSGRITYYEKTGKTKYSFYKAEKEKEALKKQILNENFIGSNSFVVLKKKDIEEVGFFDEKLKSGQDWDLWIRVIFSDKKIIGIDEPLVKYSINDDKYRISNNSLKLKESHEIIFRKIKNNYINIFSEKEQQMIEFNDKKFFLEIEYKMKNYSKYREIFLEINKKFPNKIGKKHYLRYILSFFKIKI